jgi:Ca-activated chloride channel family protein
LKFIFTILLFFSFFNRIDRGNEIKNLAKEANLYGNYTLEINLLKELIVLKKTNTDNIFLNLAHAYLNNNQPKEAFKYYLELSNSTNFTIKSIAFQQLGIIYTYKFREFIIENSKKNAEKNYSKALFFFKKSLLANPKNDEARYNFELLNIHPLSLKKPIEKKSIANAVNPEKKKHNKDKKADNQIKEGEKIEGKNQEGEFKPDQSGTEKQPSPTSKMGKGEGKNEVPSNDAAGKSNKNAPEKSDPNGSQSGGLEHKVNGRAAEHGDKGKIDVLKNIQKEKPQLNKDKLKKMNLSVQAAEQLLNKMKMAEKQYIQQQQKKIPPDHKSNNESKW